MSMIGTSVGREGVNRPEDVRLIQTLLNRHIRPPQSPLSVDGRIGTKTIAAITDFQRRVVKLPYPDGRVDPGGKTFRALVGTPIESPSRPGYALPLPGTGAGLTAEDFQRAAAALQCELACIQAVAEVESRGDGFLPSKRPKILFEAHIFSRLTQHRYDTSSPSISSRRWKKALYQGGEKEYDRLAKALALNPGAALESASWGRFQIMGYNYRLAGFLSVETFVAAMFKTEGQHLDAFVNFLRSTHLDAPLREKRWAAFARGYNGPGYAENKYDVKLQQAYEKYHSQT